ncbi:MAG TPA: MFS transporter, partial [Spirochaetia bacterium]|nr:MFS transporter [Spirochaetia bacterium]
MPFHQLRGLPGFFLLWLGQACSLLGGSMALFAVTLWVYQTTGQATPIALLGFFQMTPMVVVSLFAGALVDRYDRRLMLMVGDLATLAICLFLVVGSWTGGIQLWQIYTAGAILGTFQSFQWPATSAAVTLMVDKKHYARAASLLEMAGMSSGILAPLLAGSLLGFLGLPGILGMTAAGSLLAVVSLLFIHFPPKERSVPVPLVKIFSEIGEGIRFVLKRPPLIAVQITFLLGNFFFNLCFPLLGPLVLGRTGNNALAFAAVETAGAIGGLVGSAL